MTEIIADTRTLQNSRASDWLRISAGNFPDRVCYATDTEAYTFAVIDSRGQRVGHALFSDRSEIALRLFSRDPEPPTLDTWRDRLRQAMAFRTTLAIDATAFRVAHSEADLLPSLIVDRYGDYLVVQALSQATDRLLPELTRLLVEIAAPAGVLARNDPHHSAPRMDSNP